MRYGMPPQEAFHSHWLVRDLRGKSERNFRAYVSLFMRHLCEPGSDNAETFADGVPREGVSRQHVLTRIGIMALIRKKVKEYEEVNGNVSVPLSLLEVLGQEELEEAQEQELRQEVEKNNENETCLSNQQARLETSGVSLSEEIAQEAVKEEPVANESEHSEHHEKMNSVKGADSNDVAFKLNKAESDDKPDEFDNEFKPKITQSGVNGKEKMDQEPNENNESVEKLKEEDEITESIDAKQSKVDKDKENVSTETESNQEELTKIKREQPEVGAGDKSDETEETVDPPNSKDLSDCKPEQLDPVSINHQTEEVNPKANEGAKKESSTKLRAELEQFRRRRFMFNIADGGFTELHTLWQTEEKAAAGHEVDIWHRRHDFWLLAGVYKHGYARWQDIQNDPQFSIIDKPFHMDVSKGNFLEIKNKFLTRRMKLLEQSLVIEEQLRRASTMNETAAAATSDPVSTMTLGTKFAELETLAEAHQCLGKDAESGNKHVNSVLHKVLNQLDNLLNDMKTDVARIPTNLARIPPVSQRLLLSERSILSRLAGQSQQAQLQQLQQQQLQQLQLQQQQMQLQQLMQHLTPQQILQLQQLSQHLQPQQLAQLFDEQQLATLIQAGLLPGLANAGNASSS